MPRYLSPNPPRIINPKVETDNPAAKSQGNGRSNSTDALDTKKLAMVSSNALMRPLGWSSVSDSAPARTPRESDTPTNASPESTQGTSTTLIAMTTLRDRILSGYLRSARERASVVFVLIAVATVYLQK